MRNINVNKMESNVQRTGSSSEFDSACDESPPDIEVQASTRNRKRRFRENTYLPIQLLKTCLHLIIYKLV